MTWAESDLVRKKTMDNDFYGIVASLTYDNKKNLHAILGGGWNKYDGDHYGLTPWVKNPVDETCCLTIAIMTITRRRLISIFMVR